MANIKYESDYNTPYCSGCLSSDRVLSPLNENEDIFQMICGNYVLQTQILLCWECTALLRGVRTFQRQVANAQRTLHFYCSQKQEQPQTSIPQCLLNLTFNTKTFSITETIGVDVRQFVGEHKDLEVKTEVMQYKEDIEIKKELVECEIDFQCKKEIESEQDLDCGEDEKEELDCIEDWSNGSSVEERRNTKEETNEGEPSNTASNPSYQLLSEKSRKLYQRIYQDFIKLRLSKKFKSCSENVLLLYFEMLAVKFKSSSLWTFYSMLKSTLSIKHDVDISKYSKLMALLKRQAEGYTVKKSKTFSPEEINKFLKEAPNELYLLTKIALIFGIIGACRRQELYNVQFTDVELYDSTILVKINNTKTNTIRTFTITGSHFELCKKYIEARPEPCWNPHFFLNYRYGKCTSQKVGINKFGNLGKTMAKYLELPNPELYTGHCFRRTSATLLVNAFGDISPLKRRKLQTQATPGDAPGGTQNSLKLNRTTS